MSELHPATRGFAAADVYERGRPGYPPAAIAAIVERFDLRPGRTALDLAAGTGKLTRLLVSSGATLIALEPLAEMRAEFERHISGVELLAATAERIPLADDAVDAVTVGSGFHWFDEQRALPEIHRVLRPGGGVALMWNAADESDPIRASLSEIVEPLRGASPSRRRRDWQAVLDDSGLFERAELLPFPHVQPADEQTVVDRVLSISFVGAAPPDVRTDVERRTREVARGATQLLYTTELYLAFAKPS